MFLLSEITLKRIPRIKNQRNILNIMELKMQRYNFGLKFRISNARTLYALLKLPIKYGFHFKRILPLEFFRSTFLKILHVCFFPAKRPKSFIKPLYNDILFLIYNFCQSLEKLDKIFKNGWILIHSFVQNSMNIKF